MTHSFYNVVHGQLAENTLFTNLVAASKPLNHYQLNWLELSALSLKERMEYESTLVGSSYSEWKQMLQNQGASEKVLNELFDAWILYLSAVNATNFYSWLCIQTDRDDPIGDLAQHVTTDPKAPDGYTSKKQWGSFFKGRHPDVIEAFEEAWAMYTTDCVDFKKFSSPLDLDLYNLDQPPKRDDHLPFMGMYSWFRFNMIYCLKRLDTPSSQFVYLPLNRQYNPLGVRSNEDVDYNDYLEQAMVFETDPSTFKGIWYKETAPLFLYNDNPLSRGPDYFVRLGKLLTKEITLVKTQGRYEVGF